VGRGNRETENAMKAAIMLNRSAGTLLDLDVDDIASRIRHAFAETGHDCTILTAEAETVEKTCQKAAQEADVFVVGGGDGTIAAAAKCVAGRETSLAILPLGTMNLMARDLAIPLDLDEAIEVLARGRHMKVDVAEVTASDGISEMFLNNAVLGVMPDLAEHREASRSRKGLFKWAALLNDMGVDLANSRPQRFRIRIDGTTERVKTRAIVVSNNEIAEEAHFGLTRTRLDGGRIALYVDRHKTVLGTVTVAANGLLGRWGGNPLLKKQLVDTVEIDADRRLLPISIDGEVRELAPPLRFTIRSRALNVLVPQEDDEKD
jgi:diacylglycerol kinase family enzyme